MGSIKDKNGMDLTQAEAIKKRWQENTEELYKKNLHDQDNHNDVITHLEPDINGHEFEQGPGVDDEQGSLASCSPWGHKESDMTE